MIKLFGFLLMTVGLIGGSLAAITAYRPQLSLPDSVLLVDPPLTLIANAGAKPGPDREPVVIAERNARGDFITTLNAENLALLRASGAKRVLVKEFSFDRWEYAWAAAASIATLGVGACIVKFETRRKIRAAAADTSGDTTKGPTIEGALATIKSSLDRLQAELAGIPDEAQKNARIIEVIGELNAVQVAAVVDQRHIILGRQGMGGLANFMDKFASAERAMNRAWSAAADGVYDEAELCLARAIETIPEAQARLKGS